MNLSEEEKKLENIVNEKGYNHNNLRYSILQPAKFGVSEYEVRLEKAPNNMYRVVTLADRGSVGGENFYNNFGEASADFLKRLDSVVEYNRMVVSDPRFGEQYPSPLWDK